MYLNRASIGTVPRAAHQACVHYVELCEANPWPYMWGGAWEEGRSASLVAVEVTGRAAGDFGAELYRDDGVVVRAFGGEGLNTLRVSPNVAPTDEEIDAFVDLLDGAAP